MCFRWNHSKITWNKYRTKGHFLYQTEAANNKSYFKKKKTES